MDHRIRHGPVFSTLEFDLETEEDVIAQPNSMLSMTGGIQLHATAGRKDSGGGVWSGVKSMLGGENFFTVEFSAKKPQQRLVLAPDAIGDILELSLEELGPVFLTRGSYLANTGVCQLSIKYEGVKGLMSRKGLFLLRAQGSGTVFCQCYGAIEHQYLAAGERLFVDNRFVVAFSDTVEFQLVKATDSLKDSLFSGEGLVNRYTGPGHVYYQTRGKPGVGFLSRLFEAAF